MNMEILDRSCRTIAAWLAGRRPGCAAVLGSGWGGLAAAMGSTGGLPYGQIACMGATGVAGHAGRLAVAALGDLDVLIFEGRRHFYEGAGWEPVVLPAVACRELGIPVMLTTNAAGGVRADLAPGTLMVIDDHINLMGANPLVGPHGTRLGPRFPDLSAVYDAGLRAALDAAGGDAGEALAHGVYGAVSGPVYETPAEVRMLERLGVDAVGMSTVPEATVARAAGIRVAGLSCIANAAAGRTTATLSHDDVIRLAREAQPRMQAVVRAFLARLAHEVPSRGAAGA